MTVLLRELPLGNVPTAHEHDASLREQLVHPQIGDSTHERAFVIVNYN